MQSIENLNLGGIPEKFKQEGVFAHYREFVHVGDVVEAICNANHGKISCGTKARITNIIINPKPDIRGFEKRITLEGFEGYYNPKRFKKIEEGY